MKKKKKKLTRSRARLHHIQTEAEQLTTLLTQVGEHSEARVARKFLIASLLASLPNVRAVDTLRLLQNLRDFYRATHREEETEKPAAMTAAERRRRIREIYGWKPEDICPRCGRGLTQQDTCQNCGWQRPEPVEGQRPKQHGADNHEQQPTGQENHAPAGADNPEQHGADTLAEQENPTQDDGAAPTDEKKTA